MRKFHVKKYNPSDDSYWVQMILIDNESLVEKGDVLFSIESSKAVVEIEAEESGYCYFNLKENDTLEIGDLLYIISEKKNVEWEKFFNKKVEFSPKNITISKKASALLNMHNISPQQLGKKIIKELDVIEFLEKNSSNETTLETSLIKNLREPNKIPLIIIGAKGGAKMCIDTLRNNADYEVVGLLDDAIEIGTNVLNVPVIGRFNSFEKLHEIGYENYILAFGIIENRKKRFFLYKNMLEKGCKFPNIIHCKAIVEESVSLGQGNIILAGANVGSAVKLGNLNYINNSSVVSHDCVLDDNIHIAPGAVLASSIHIGSHSLIGMNSSIYIGVEIAEGMTIKNGDVVNSNVN